MRGSKEWGLGKLRAEQEGLQSLHQKAKANRTKFHLWVQLPGPRGRDWGWGEG